MNVFYVSLHNRPVFQRYSRLGWSPHTVASVNCYDKTFHRPDFHHAAATPQQWSNGKYRRKAGKRKTTASSEENNSDLVVDPVNGISAVLEDRLERHVQITTLHACRLTAHMTATTYLLSQTNNLIQCTSMYGVTWHCIGREITWMTALQAQKFPRHSLQLFAALFSHSAITHAKHWQ